MSKEAMKQHFFETIKEFQTVYPSAMLTGTAALILYGFNLGRMPSDLDFILPDPPEKIPSNWSAVQMPDNFQAKCYWMPLNGIRIEIILWKEYSPIEIRGIKVTKLEDLLEAKRDLGLTGTKKHLHDFFKIAIQLQSQLTEKDRTIAELREGLEKIANNKTK